MKNAVLGFIIIMLLVLSGMFMMMIRGKEARQNELNSSLAAAVEQSLTVLMEQTKERTQEETNTLIADAVQNVLFQITSDADITIHVLAADGEKGLLDVEAVESFYHLNGMKDKIVSRKTAILEEYNNIAEQQFTVSFSGKAPDGIAEIVYSQYNVYGGGTVIPPEEPIAIGFHFKGWRLEGNPEWDGNFEKLFVTKNLIFRAVFEKEV